MSVSAVGTTHCPAPSGQLEYLRLVARHLQTILEDASLDVGSAQLPEPDEYEEASSSP